MPPYRRLRPLPTPRLVVALAAVSLLVLGCATTPPAAPPGEVVGKMMRTGLPSSGTTFAGSQRVLARAPGGTLYLAYTKRIDGIDQVYVARSTDGGRSWNDFPQISSGRTNSNNPDIVVSPEGVVHLFWTKHEAYPPTGASSTGWGSAKGSKPASAAETATAKNGFVKPGQGSGGGYSKEDYGSVRQLFSSTYDGRAWSPQHQLTHGDYNGFPSAAYDSHGVLHMVWYGYDGRNYQVIYSSLARGRWSAPRQISVGYPDSVNPAIAVDTHDNLHVAWYKYSPATKSYQIFYREYRAAGQSWGAGDLQISDGLVQAVNVSITVTPDDSVWVAFEGLPVADGGEPPVSGIYLRRLHNGRWSRQFLASIPGQRASEPSLTVAPNGTVCLFYQGDRSHQLYLTEFTGTRWSAPRRLTRSGTNGYPNALQSSPFSRPRDATAGKGKPAHIDYAWTQLNADPMRSTGKNTIRFGSAPVN